MTDDRFDHTLFDAFDRMSPSEEAETRMLDAVLTEFGRTSTPLRKRKSAFWKKALPIAACLVLALGLGTFTLWNTSINTPLSNGAAGAASSSGTAPSASQEGAATSSSVPPSDSAVRYPFVTLSSGEQLRVTFADEGLLVADPSLIGNKVEDAFATNDVESESSPCTVFATSDAAHPYAVRYAGDDTFYLAELLA